MNISSPIPQNASLKYGEKNGDKFCKNVFSFLPILFLYNVGAFFSCTREGFFTVQEKDPFLIQDKHVCIACSLQRLLIAVTRPGARHASRGLGEGYGWGGEEDIRIHKTPVQNV